MSFGQGAFGAAPFGLVAGVGPETIRPALGVRVAIRAGEVWTPALPLTVRVVGPASLVLPVHASVVPPVVSLALGVSASVFERVRLGLLVAFIKNIGGRLGEEVHLRERCAHTAVAVSLDGVTIAGGLRVAGARQDAGLPHAQDVLPVPARGAQAQGAEPDVLALRHLHLNRRTCPGTGLRQMGLLDIALVDGRGVVGRVGVVGGGVGGHSSLQLVVNHEEGWRKNFPILRKFSASPDVGGRIRSPRGRLNVAGYKKDILQRRRFWTVRGVFERERT